MSTEPITLNLARLNNFMRLAMGGWDSLPCNDERIRDDIFPIIRQLDPDEKYYHLEGDIIWRIDPWKELMLKMEARRAQRLVDEQVLEMRKLKLEQLVEAIQKAYKLPTKAMAEGLALEIVRKGGVEVAKVYGVDISDLGGMELKPHVVLEEGKVTNEY